MTIYFDDSLRKLKRRLSKLDNSFERLVLKPGLTTNAEATVVVGAGATAAVAAATGPGPARSIDRIYLQEGLISGLWQTWCIFCREVLMGSLTGGVTTKGVNVTSIYSTYSDRELVNICRKFADNKPLGTVNPVAAHVEMTWGDKSKLHPMITLFAPQNQATLLSALSGVYYLVDLQKIRNANAHITSFTMSDVISCKVRYSDTKFRHPSDSMYWIDPVTRDYLWKTWVEEMEIVAELMAE